MVRHPRRGLLGAEVGERGAERQQVRLYTGRRRLVHKGAARGFREGQRQLSLLAGQAVDPVTHADERSAGVDN